MLEINSKVCIITDLSTVGLITNKRDDGTYEVFINNETSYFSEESLQLVLSTDLFDSYKNIEEGSFGDQSDLNSLVLCLTYEQIAPRSCSVFWRVALSCSHFLEIAFAMGFLFSILIGSLSPR